MIREIASKFNEITLGNYKVIVVDRDGKEVSDLRFSIGEGEEMRIETALITAIKIVVNGLANRSKNKISKLIGSDERKSSTRLQ